MRTIPVAPRPLFRAYAATWGYDEWNPSKGGSRFAPFKDPVGTSVPTLYLAESEEAALLETVFHDVVGQPDPVVYEVDLLGMLIPTVRPPRRLNLLDLRDPELDRMSIGRSELVSTSAEHYPCTQQVALDVHHRVVGRSPVDGMVWHSRQAEVLGETAEVMVVFGDRYQVDRGGWPFVHPGVRALMEGEGRTLVDRVANRCDAVVVTDP